jgi:ferric-dicitrate binding protein FerR (iron transport regulator)
MADMDDDTTILLAEGMTNARAFREMLPLWQELRPELQLDPSDMGEQLRQALNNRRAWSLTCYGAILLIFLFLYGLYLLVALIGSHVHH